MAQSAASRQVGILHHLLTLDDISGCRAAAAETSNRVLRRRFLGRASDRPHIAEWFAEATAAPGGWPVADGRGPGAARRVFLNLREVLQSGDAVAICEMARGRSCLCCRCEEASRSGLLCGAVSSVTGCTCTVAPAST